MSFCCSRGADFWLLPTPPNVEFGGFEDTMPNATLPRDSDRIWRGSMKGKVRKGEGASG